MISKSSSDKPDAGNLHVRFDERRLETKPRRGVRHRNRRKPPATATPFAYRHRASRRLYMSLVSTLERFNRRCDALRCVWDLAADRLVEIGAADSGLCLRFKVRLSCELDGAGGNRANVRDNVTLCDSYDQGASSHCECAANSIACCFCLSLLSSSVMSRIISAW